MQCINCGSHLEPNWTHCPHCGKFKSVLKEPVSEEAVEVIFGKMMGGKDKSGSGSYGSGVRGQVFEVIVRQAMAGAPWREICAGPMQVNKIDVEDIEAEVQRRRNILLAPKVFKKDKDEKSQKGKDAKKGKDAQKGSLAQPHDTEQGPWGPAPAPPRPTRISAPPGGLRGGSVLPPTTPPPPTPAPRPRSRGGNRPARPPGPTTRSP